MYLSSEIEMLADGLLDHAECVAAGPDGNLYLGGQAGQIYRMAADGSRVETYANTGGGCGGIAIDRENNLFVCDYRLAKLFRVTPQGDVTVFSEGTADRKFLNPNYPVFDRNGNLYMSDSGGWKGRNGLIYRIAPGGDTTVFHPGPFHFTNGLALDAEERYLYVVESNLDRVLRVEIRNDGTPGEVSVYAEGVGRVPDGLAFDAEGNLYVTTYANDRIYRVRPSRQVELLVEDGESFALVEPTNCAFGGPGMDRLFVANLGGWHVAALDLHVKGQMLYSHRPAGS